MSSKQGLLSSLRHRDYRLLMAAFTASTIGSWAYNVALAVWIFDETGSAAWVGVATIGRFIPALLFSAYGGVLADRFERVKLMITLDAASFVVMAGLAAETAVRAPVLLAIATAAVTSTIATAYEPAVAAMTPQLVGERDLGSANALRSTLDNICVVAGPGLGALLLLVGSASLAIGVNALSYLVSAIIVARIGSRSRPVDVTEGGQIGALRQTLVGARVIVSSSTIAALVAYSVIATFVFGTDRVLFVVLSRDVLGTGAEGYGYLLAGLGAGGVLAAGMVTRLERRPQLGVVILVGMAVYCLPTLVFLVVASPVVAFFVEAVRGAGTLVVDVLAVTALQRSLPRDLLARVFGAFNALLLTAIILGALFAPLVLGWLGLDVTLWIVGLGIPAVSVLGWPLLQQMDRTAAVRRAALAPTLALLDDCDLFESTREGGIEQLAGAAEEVTVRAGQTIIAQGHLADAFYVIAEGTYGVTAIGEAHDHVSLDDLTVGDYFGEIGLIENLPRSATVTALTPGRLLRMSGTAFVDSLTESAPSPALLDGASLRLRRTHPSLPITRSGLHNPDDRDGDEVPV